MKRAIIFDLDGTLLDTIGDLTDAVNYALEKNGRRLRTEKEILSFVGNGMPSLVKSALDGEENRTVYDDFQSYYSANCMVRTKPYEGVTELLPRLKEDHLLGLVSNKEDFAVQKIVRHYFGDLFDCIIGVNSLARKKPYPDMLYNAISALDLKKSDCVFVGDSDVDIKTAQNADVDIVCVSWGFRTREFLTTFGVDKIADTTDELLSFLTK